MIDLIEYQKLLVPAAETIFDVGASEGTTVRKYLEHYPQARVFAFEPQPDAYQALRRIAQSEARLTVESFALSQQAGQAIFYLCSHPASSSLLPFRENFQDFTVARTVLVGESTLDQYLIEHGIRSVDILKLDVNGCELKVLRGAARALAEERISLIVTELLFYPYYAGQCWHYEVSAHLAQFGYELLALYPVYWGSRLRYADGVFRRAGQDG
jgi:FkbM family methyltransferase